jgi:single-strand selective monofunctional uracil DNA glycosylase
MSPLLHAMDRLRNRASELRFGDPVAVVYNPLDYAWDVARAYVERFGQGPKDTLLLGMNPGPFGMGQTGVPFGEISAVRDYLGLSGEIRSPRRVHEKRPILGFSCPRREVSGQRLWGALAKRYPIPEDLFRRAFVLNYCPLLFVSESGANVTPDKLTRAERHALETICDEGLREAIEALSPKHIVGIGGYAAKCAERVTGRSDIITMPHPSPASPAANRGWEAAARTALERGGLSGFL